MSKFDGWLNSNNPLDDADDPDVTEDHVERAEKEVSSDMDDLASLLVNSSSLAEYAAALYDTSDLFKAEVHRERKESIEIVARRLANEDAQSGGDYD